ncbi:glycosyltransferase [Jiangella alkaliphila]|uniref:Glycosyltransferase involved in cell wall bisynthesis n=1 Tax=Jiangella alkaliphila TaxID=419479 RepID=A0A1H2M143_9ACTN|nr:glycosyltransferase [Jiangella alkaliphila]SDU86725.1 Glycosyltransferase involved in cell wall bisynthesis [Jiangella alkaliphila]
MGALRSDVGIVSAGHDVADARLHKIAAALVRQGLSVEVFGLGDVTGGPRDARVVTSPRGSLIRRAFRAVNSPLRCRAKVLITLDPDVVPVARAVGALRGRKVVVDVHEDYARLLADRAWARGALGLGAKLVVRLSTKLAASADITSVVDHHIPPTTARHRMVVENMPDLGLLSSADGVDPEPRAVYVGDLRESRGLFDMVEAVARVPEWTLDLVGPVAPGDAARLRERLLEPDVAGRVRLHGRKPPAEAWRIVAGAWVGLVFLRETPAFREAMPTKLYEYLASGMPVLTTRLPRQAALVEQTGAGVVVDSVDDAASALRRWSESRTELDVLAKAAHDWATAQQGASPYDELAVAVARLLGRDVHA